MSVKVILSKEDKIQIKTIQGLIEDISGMNPEYIIEFLKNQIEIIKNGI
jgi:predicted metallopeptidase